MTDETSIEFVRTVAQTQPTSVTTEKYNNWELYEEAMKVAQYRGPQLAANAFAKLELDKNASILDVGAGTGLFGKELYLLGYTNLVALDPSDILEKAKLRGIYKGFIKNYVKKGHKLDPVTDLFDVVAMCGVMAPGHMHIEDLIELIPVVKKGGLICWASVDKGFYADVDSRYSLESCDAALQEYISSGLFKVHGDPQPLPKYYRGQDGIFYAVEVL